jgi:hypothetical protein
MSQLRKAALRLAETNETLRPALLRLLTATEKQARYGFDDWTLKQMALRVNPAFDPTQTRVSSQIRRAADSFVRGLSNLLSVWTQKFRPENGGTLLDLMEDDAAYKVYAMLSDEPGGLGRRWPPFYDDTLGLQDLLMKGLAREYRALRAALVKG